MFASISTLAPRMRFTSKPDIENCAFKLHFKFTVTMLILFVILVCGKDYFGDHIKCVSDKDAAPAEVINTFCFVTATFTITRYYNESVMKTQFITHPGVGPLFENDETVYHTYYQWVPFALCLQAILFYMPHFIWKKKEAGRIKLLVDGLEHATLAQDEELKCKTEVIPSKQNVTKKLEIIKLDILLRLRITKTWSNWLVGMEIMNFLNIALQIWFTDYFLNGLFTGLGLRFISFNNWGHSKINPLDIAFPKVTKCIFPKFGTGGSVQNHDAMCVMALNVVHEKIYLIMWFWFMILFIVSLLAVIWRIATFFLYSNSPRFIMMMFQRANSAKLHPALVLRVMNSCCFADWLFLYYLAKNMHRTLFEALFRQIAEELDKRDLPQYNQCRQKREPWNYEVTYDDEKISQKGEQKPF